MPNISKAEYEALMQQVESLTNINQALRNSEYLLHTRMHTRTEQFNEILNKISRASWGVDIVNHNVRGYENVGMGMSPGSYAEVRPMPTLSRNERAEQREAELQMHIRKLECRLASVNVLVQFAQEQFAQEHKA